MALHPRLPMPLRTAPWLALAMLSLAACGSDSVYREEKDLPEAGWAYRDTLDFSFEIEDTSRVYNLYLHFEHVDTFAFQNLYLRLYTRFPNGRRLSRVRSFELFGAQGDSNGKCSGRDCRVELVLQENAFFNQPGTYVLTLEQYTRQENLPGIRAVGLAVEPVKPEGD